MGEENKYNLSEEYCKLQYNLSKKVSKVDSLDNVKYVSGVDVAYEKKGDKVIAAITVLEFNTLELIETAVHIDNVSFPYIPGLFSFRELPPILKAINKLQTKPDLIVVDGQGYAHPRRFGLACHLGIELDIPTIGCAKSRLLGEYAQPETKRSNSTDLIDKGEVIGKVLRTQDNVKPLFVSIGHKISIETACDYVLKMSPNYRLPETTRTADHAVRIVLKDLNKQSLKTM